MKLVCFAVVAGVSVDIATSRVLKSVSNGSKTHEFLLGLKLDESMGDYHHYHRNDVEFGELGAIRESALARTHDTGCLGHVENVLKSKQLNATSTHAGYYMVSGKIDDIKSLFNAVEFHEYETGNNQVTTRATCDGDIHGLWKDARMQACVGFLGRLTDFPNLRPIAQANVAASSTSTITPKTLTDMYGVPTASPDVSNTFSQAVWEFSQANTQSGQLLTMQYSPVDLKNFQTHFGIPLNQPKVNALGSMPSPVDNNIQGCVSSIDPTKPSGTCLEPNLDLEYLTALSNENTVYETFADYADMVQRIVGFDSKTKVLSISYSSDETLSAKTNMIHICNEFKNLVSSGVTVFVASGDQGATNGNTGIYTPAFPATCPFVTAVGATNGFQAKTEVVASSGDVNGVITSGGGFSMIFTDSTQFSYQSAAVKNYLQNDVGGSASGYNASGRAYPDISAAGVNYQVVSGGKLLLLSGTSASAPVLAAITANVVRKNGGKGFGNINSLLYKGLTQQKFFDVVEGNNLCSSSFCQPWQPTGQNVGFRAAAGWDPASGVGTLGTGNGGYAAFENLLLQNSPAPSGGNTGGRIDTPLVYSLLCILYIFSKV
uniref:subtilisin n=1 Tax=Mucochytrium quahogii TaxID=96639 RepID=A0A7S2SCS1_9STRA|mmetsp:Transcript_42184/g.67486  ORF Transcript_42184/g.67486 Transcript_42184/m.67486 type:complete len:602 (-) Transcript_42184:129-1934(-)